MNATTKTLTLALLALALMAAPASAEDTGEASSDGPCRTFYFTVIPPAYHLDPTCPLQPAEPVFDNSP